MNRFDLMAIASSLGHSARMLEDGGVEWEDELRLGRTRVEVLVMAEIDAEDILISVGCLPYEADEVRVGRVAPEPPLVVVEWVDDDGDTGDPDDIAEWLVVRGLAAACEGDEGVKNCVGAAVALLGDLARRCIIRLVDASDEDPWVLNHCPLLTAALAQRPYDATELLLELGRRAQAVGDHTLAVASDLAAAELAADCGDFERCWNLTEPAWQLLDAPVHKGEIAVAYATALSAYGDYDQAIAVLTESESLVTDPEKRAHVRLNRGIVLLQCDRTPEAIGVIQGCIADPMLAEEQRLKAQRLLADALRMVGVEVPPPPREGYRVSENVDDILNDIAVILTTTPKRADQLERLSEVDALIARVIAKERQLGAGQRARLTMSEAIVAFHRGDLVTARRKVRSAQIVASEAGDAAIIRSAEALVASMPHPDGSIDPARVLPPHATARERLMFHFNRMYYPTMAAIARGTSLSLVAEQGLPDALEAVLAVDEARQRLLSVAERRSFTEIGMRAYAMAMLLAQSLNRQGLVVELIERVRAQGLPARGDRFEPPMGLRLGELAVDRPAFATVSGSSELEPGRSAVRLGDLVVSVGGEGSWWWTGYHLGPTVTWVVREPGGQLMVGSSALDEAEQSRLAQVTATFTTPRGGRGLAASPLAEDHEGELDALLRDAARLLLPPPLVEAALVAAATGSPLRLVWAPPPELGNVAVGMLPLDERYRLLHGAVITVAPPTSIVAAAHDPSADPAGSARPAGPTTESIVVGHEGGLRHVEDLVGPRGLAMDPDRVLGPTPATRGPAPLALDLATPEAVLRTWRDPTVDLALYYGHVDEGLGGSATVTSLRLTDGEFPAPLEAGKFLTPERHGAPRTAVLCGCSSMEPTSVGSGEWWGFAVALLWQGSRHVIGSLWPLVDCAANTAFAIELANRIRAGFEPALALHGLQIDYLDEWERSRAAPFSGATADRHPILWAGWSLTGVR